jgi:hypothetical protein
MVAYRPLGRIKSVSVSVCAALHCAVLYCDLRVEYSWVGMGWKGLSIAGLGWDRKGCVLLGRGGTRWSKEELECATA